MTKKSRPQGDVTGMMGFGAEVIIPKWLLNSGKKRMMLHDVTHIGMSICPSPARICSKRKLTTQGFIRNQGSGEIRRVVGEIHHASE